jgi:hypothetical protein
MATSNGFECKKHCQLFGTDSQTPSLGMRISKKNPFLVAATPQAKCLKQPEQFKDDYDNNNYSDYVEDASVHVFTDIRLVSGGQHLCN